MNKTLYKIARYKKYLIDGKYYTIRQLSLKLKLSHHRVKAKLIEGASTLQGLKVKVFERGSPNYEHSMYADKNGHWKLLAKALGC
jgi:hypothetical protein